MSYVERPQPIDAAVTPRFVGPATFMRLPLYSSPIGLDVALTGVPFDGGTTNRAGARQGPREVRNQSTLIRRTHHASGISPYDLINVADIGDAPTNPFSIETSLQLIEDFFKDIKSSGAIPITVGGDHLITLPILRALAREAPIGLIHFDAHSDTNDSYFGGSRYTHGTPFRRAIEEGLLDPKRVIQLGIRGSSYDANELQWAKEQGVTIRYIEDIMATGLDAIMDEAIAVAGEERVYLSFDIDVIDPSMAPGTGTPEIGGLTTREAQLMLRRLQGVDIIGADVVEISPPFDMSNMTALVGATLMFEILCLVASRHQSGSGYGHE
ncbi:MAG: agmatinase [Candidatus Pacebacteria bacterium]|jgi:guanidinopropionase|uniref:agmatinase n=1 Tax=Acidithiobacillus ferridurans TaxID=1232575 RepID=UPI001C06A977|nr:agmatinase [Acidithiobacillus ferridurans]MBU2732654.1 agmatinase [Acidithiobacillus ferridurans]MDD5318803.1 agmatinase [Candidatus Paceibacterota bacterium]